VARLEWQPREEVVYRSRLTTEYRPVQRTIVVPRVEYVYEQRLHGWWNPFVEPHVAYHLVPRTRWETRQQTVQLPVTYWEMVRDTEFVQKPVRKLGFAPAADSTWTARTPAANSPAPRTARATDNYGGLRLENDPPRQPASVVR
jgi:hypothetical protein